jgi:hypothetical protein
MNNMRARPMNRAALTNIIFEIRNTLNTHPCYCMFEQTGLTTEKYSRNITRALNILGTSHSLRRLKLIMCDNPEADEEVVEITEYFDRRNDKFMRSLVAIGTLDVFEVENDFCKILRDQLDYEEQKPWLKIENTYEKEAEYHGSEAFRTKMNETLRLFDVIDTIRDIKWFLEVGSRNAGNQGLYRLCREASISLTMSDSETSKVFCHECLRVHRPGSSEHIPWRYFDVGEVHELSLVNYEWCCEEHGIECHRY